MLVKIARTPKAAATAIAAIDSALVFAGTFRDRRTDVTRPAITNATTPAPGISCRSGPLSDDVHPHNHTSGDAVTYEVTSALNVMMSLNAREKP